jgi:UDPglucose 6-dehydrogenase
MRLKMDISVIGLGKLGLPTAACFALKGNKVFGWDNNQGFLEELWKGNCPIQEPGLKELIEEAGENLIFARNIESAVARSDITLIIVPTPSLPEGGFDNSYVMSVLESMGSILRTKVENGIFHVVDVVSTVMPGSCQKEFIPFLEEATGGKCGDDLGLIYNPEFIALGSVIKDFMNPDFVLVGESDRKSGDMMAELYMSLFRPGPYRPNVKYPSIRRMSLINAEIAKLSLNYYVTMKISYANFLAVKVCTRFPGADVDVITDAIGCDSRIGHKYLKGGLGFGGPCFPRDVRAMSQIVHKEPYYSMFSQHEINGTVAAWIEQKVLDKEPRAQKVAILGMAYKPGTHVIEESQSVELARTFEEHGYEVHWYDRCVPSSAIPGPSFPDQDSLPLVIKDADVVILALPEKYRWQVIDDLVADDAMIIDCWRMAKDFDWKRARYYGLGVWIESRTG